MITKESRFEKVREGVEDTFVEAPANLSECSCASEHRLHVALSETRARPVVFAPDYTGLKDAYCETFGRRCR
jgi:hypothetical protein